MDHEHNPQTSAATTRINPLIAITISWSMARNIHLANTENASTRGCKRKYGRTSIARQRDLVSLTHNSILRNSGSVRESVLTDRTDKAEQMNKQHKQAKQAQYRGHNRVEKL